MWNDDVLDKVEEIYMGCCESHALTDYVRNYLCFYACNSHGDYYDVSYDAVYELRQGKRTNPFSWIAYMPYMPSSGNEYETVFRKS